jgi:hypothetical protein
MNLFMYPKEFFGTVAMDIFIIFILLSTVAVVGVMLTAVLFVGGIVFVIDYLFRKVKAK